MRFIKSESGAVTIVEATLVFPFILFVLGFFILTSLYVLQKATLSADVERVALVVSKTKAIPGYDQLGQVVSEATDFERAPTGAEIASMISTMDPYRYHTCEIEGLDSLYTQFATIIGEEQFLSPSRTDYSVSCQSNGFGQEMMIEASQQINLPLFVSVLGFDEAFEIKTTARATVSDPAELIRNMGVANEVEFSF